MTILLGGAAAPLGDVVQFVRADVAAVLDAAVEIHEAGPGRVRVDRPRPFLKALPGLLPFEAPWTRELVMSCGPDWTAYLNNFVHGGDSSAIAAAIARRLDVDHVVATNSQRRGAIMQATQFWFHGREGRLRTLDAYCADRRWSWHEHGDPLPFEDLDRYTARLKRDRLDRELLLDYLDALGIAAREDRIYGPGIVVRQKVSWKRRTVSWADERRLLGLDTAWPPANGPMSA